MLLHALMTSGLSRLGFEHTTSRLWGERLDNEQSNRLRHPRALNYD